MRRNKFFLLIIYIHRIYNTEGVVMFTKNVGSIDRILRIIIGLVLLSLVFFGPQTPWGYIGVILVITAFMNFCPLYAILRMSSLKK